MKRLFISLLLILFLSFNVLAGQIVVESEQTYQALTPSVLTAYKALSFLPSDVLSQSSGSAIGGSLTVTECVDSNQGAICFWYYPYNWGNAGQLRYLYDCWVDANNRISVYISTTNNLTLDVIGAGTTRTASTSFATIKPFTWNHTICTWSKNTDVNGTNNSYVYLNGAGAGQTSATVAIASVPSIFSIGSDKDGKNSANGLLAYKIMRQYMTSDQVTADYNSGNGSLDFFTVTPHCIALGLTSENSTGVKYSHTGQSISTISTVTLTLGATIGSRSWTNGDQVVIWDDADPPNVVRTTINGVPSGSTIVVADSCAGIVGTNKFISKNLIVDSMMGLTATSAWTAGVDTTLSKNTTTPISDTSDLKVLNTSTTQGEATQTVTTIATSDYYLYGLIKPQITPLASARIIDVDGTASMSQTVGQAKLMGKNVDCNRLYNAKAVDNTKLDVTTEDFSFSCFIKCRTSGIYYGRILEKKSAAGIIAGYSVLINFTKLYIEIADGTNMYYLTSNMAVNDGKWHHVTAVIDKDDKSKCKLYIDGIVNVSGTSGSTGVNNITNTIIATLGSTVINSNIFDGQICDAKIAIGTVWTAAEVLYQYNNPFDVSASAGTITEAYSCTEGTGTTLTALVTPVTNNLTLSNVLAWNLGEVQEVGHCFQAQDTDTTIDLTVPCAVSGELAYWDNVKMISSLVANGGIEKFTNGGNTTVPDSTVVTARTGGVGAYVYTDVTGWNLASALVGMIATDGANEMLITAVDDAGDNITCDETKGSGVAIATLTIISIKYAKPTSWLLETNATSIADTTPHAGSRCLKVTTGAVNVGVKQSITLVSGQYYTIVGYVKVTAGDSAGIYMDTGTGTIVTIGTTTATTWTRIRGSFKAVGTAGVIYFRGIANGDIAWCDDLALIRDDYAVASTATKGSGIVPSNQLLIR